MKKRIKADSVEELFEIVRAVQNGEEPEEYQKRKAAAIEAERQARKEEALRQEKLRKQREAEAAAEKEFERLLEEDPEEELEEAAGAFSERFKETKERFKETVARWKEEAKERRRVRKEELAKAREAERARKEEERRLHEQAAGEEAEELDEANPEQQPEPKRKPEQRKAGLWSVIGERMAKRKPNAEPGDESGQESGQTQDGSQKVESELRIGLESQVEPEGQPKAEAIVEPGRQIDPEPSVKPELESVAEPERQPQSEPESVAEPARQPQSEPESVAEPERQPQSEPEPVAEPERQSEPSIEQAPKPAPAPEPAPVARPRRERLTDTLTPAEAGKTHRRYGAWSISEEAENIGRHILSSLRLTQDGEGKKAREAKKELKKELEKEKKTEDIREGQEKVENETTISPNTEKENAKPPNATKAIKEAMRKEARAKQAAKRAKRKEEAAQRKAERDERKAEDTKKKTQAKSARNSLPTLGELRAKLTQKLPDRKNGVLFGAAAVLALVLILLIVSVISSAITTSRKKAYVSADAGLTVLVENQPKTWCNSCDLTIRVSVKGGTVSKVMVAGMSYTPDDKGYITFTAVSASVAVTVVADTGTYAATVELPRLDAVAPELTVTRFGDQIVLTASDDNSDVKTIWYAAVSVNDYLGYPQYVEYTEAINREENCTYYFFAEDNAGNHSTPMITTLEEAESVVLNETEVTLFVSETAGLTAQVLPEGALVGEISYASADETVVTVDAEGRLTAVSAGSAWVTVSVDGGATAACMVTVADSATITISAIGDCTLGTDETFSTATNFTSYYNTYGATYFFENVRDILANDDLTFANFEGTLTTSTSRADKTYAFKGDPSYTDILLDGSIEVVTLANNHSSDYGSDSLTDTKTYLTEAGISYCMGDTIAYEEVNGILVACIGIYELADGMGREAQVRSTIAAAKAAGARLILIAFHWGTELATEPDETQQELAHIAIDCGADLVIGHHPHVLQGIEKYNGKYIVYSLGNFCFGGNSNPSDYDTMIFRQTFTLDANGVSLDDDIEIVPCSVSAYTTSNNYQPTPQSGDAADSILAKINTYSAAFGDLLYSASTGLD